MSNSTVQTAMELQEMHELMDSTFQTLVNLWTVYGHEEDAMRQRRHRLVKNLKDLCDDMIGVEKLKDIELRNAIKAKIEKVVELSRHLDVDPEVDNYGPDSTRSLLDQDYELGERKNALEAQKKVRMARYDYLREQEKLICEELDEPVAVIDFDGIPHDDQVAELDAIVKNWKQEKITRTAHIEGLQSSIGSLFSALEKTPDTPVEKMAVAAATPQLTTKNINELEALQRNMKEEYEANRGEAEGLRKRIRDLWKRLSTPEEVTSAFDNKYTGCKPSVITELINQLNLLEEEKMRNIERFIREIRKEINEIWNICYASEEERRKFYGMASDEYTEDLLDAHEQELAKWKTYYEVNKKFIEAVTQWEHHWISWVQLEAMDDDPVLIANRGGARLKHEKAKKGEQKLYEKYEKDIKKCNDEYLIKYGCYFMVKGFNILDYIEEQKNLAELDRQERKNIKKKQAEETRAMTPGTRKRGCPLTPSSKLGPSKKSKFALPSVGGTFIRTPAEKAGVQLRTTGHGSNQTRYIPPRTGEPIDLISPASTYSEFTNHLLKSTALSSSVCQPLGPQNTGTRSGTRQGLRTENKPPLQLARHGMNDVQNQF